MPPEPNTPRTLGRGAALAGAAQVGAAASGALVGIAVARLLGPDGMGAYALAVSLLLVLTTLGTLGLETGLVYRVGSGRWSPAAAWAQTQATALVLGAAGVLVALAARAAMPEAFAGLTVGLVAIVAGALPFALSWQYASATLLAVDRYEAYAAMPIVHAAATLAGVPALAAAFGLEGAVVGLALAHVAAAALGAVLARARRPPEFGLRRGLGELRAAVAFGGKAYLANALQFLNYRLDFFVLSAAATTAAVGRYSVAVAVTSLGWLLPRGLSTVLFPRVAALTARSDASTSRDGVETSAVRHAVLVSSLSAAVLVGVLVLLVPPVFGSAFREAVGLGLVLLPGVALLGVAGVLMATVVGRGRPGYSLAVSLAGTPATVALYLVLIPRYGAVGAAVASTLSYALSFLLAAAAYRRVTGRRVVTALRPTRAELADYRRLLGALRLR